MIDLHSHILPGLDDGAKSYSESIEMAKLAVENGVTAMVATPHCIDDRKKEIRKATLILRDLLSEKGIPLKIYMGMEIFGTAYTSRLLREKRLFTLNNSRYPLVEFSFNSSGEEETHILQDMIWAGYTPLVAHPERYNFIKEDPEIINTWKRMGCLFQINRGSIMGRFGKDAQIMGVSLLKRGFCTAVASDAHSPMVRTPYLKDVKEVITRALSEEKAEELLHKNPRTILKNEEIISGEEPQWY